MSVLHQAVSTNLAAALGAHFRGTPWRVLLATDVLLGDIRVQPDVLVCDHAQLERTHVEGPPRLVIEIISPETFLEDRCRKQALYAKSGVQEYWLVTPHPAMVEVIHQVHGCSGYMDTDTLRSGAFPDLVLDLRLVFADLPPQPDLNEVKAATPEYLATLLRR